MYWTRKSTLLIIIIIILSGYALPVMAGRYPPNVAATVKLKRAVTYPEGHKLTKVQQWRVRRNIKNAYRKNYRCYGAINAIDLTGYHSMRNHHGLAMVFAQRAIDEAYKCYDRKWYRENVK